MKYLKTYKIFEGIDEMATTMEEIFYELDNELWVVDVHKPLVEYVLFNNYEVNIYIKNAEAENYDVDDETRISGYRYNKITEDVVECIERTIQYAKSLGYKSSLSICERYPDTNDEEENWTVDDIKIGDKLYSYQHINIKIEKSS